MFDSKNNSIRYLIWIVVFIILLASIPTFILLGFKLIAKLVGIFTVLLIAFAIRRWLYVATKMKGKPAKVKLNLNDRYWLNEHIPFYKSLSKQDKVVFEDRISLFLTDIIITEIEKEVPDREVCLYVSCSAVIAYWGLPYWNYGRLSEVLVYPTNFTAENHLATQGEVVGKVFQGGLMDTTMILSLPALKDSFSSIKDHFNVGVHEFSHLVDKSDGSIDGVPGIVNRDLHKRWIQICAREIQLIIEGKSDINEYAATNTAEFYAVCMEYFKEDPIQFQQKHPELYALILQIYSEVPS